MNFPDILSTTCDTRLPIPLSAFGIDLTLPLQWPDTSLGTLHLLLEPRLYPISMCGTNCKIIDICWRIEDAGVRGPNPLADMDPPSQIWTPLPNFPFKHPLYHIW